MKVILDVRESTLLAKCTQLTYHNGHTTGVSLESRQLPLGDVLFESDDGHPVLIIERKSMSDLLSSIRDGRYKEQSCRLSCTREYPQHNVVYLIEGTLDSVCRDLSAPERRKVLSVMASLQYFKGFSVVRTMSLGETAEYILWTADKIDRTFSEGVLPFVYRWPSAPTDGTYSGENTTTLIEKCSGGGAEATMLPGFSYSSVIKPVKKDNITAANIGHMTLCAVPGISSAIAVAIMAHPAVHGSVPALMTVLRENAGCLALVRVTGRAGTVARKVGPAIVQKLVALFIAPGDSFPDTGALNTVETVDPVEKEVKVIKKRRAVKTSISDIPLIPQESSPLSEPVVVQTVVRKPRGKRLVPAVTVQVGLDPGTEKKVRARVPRRPVYPTVSTCMFSEEDIVS